MELLTKALLLVFIIGLSGEECPDCTGGVREDCCQWRCYHDTHNWYYDISCEDGAIVDVTDAVFGFSKCTDPDPCCPMKEDCRVPVVDYKPERQDYIHKQCDGRSKCEYLQAERAANIKECNNGMSNYEIIYFDCVSKHPKTTTEISTSAVEETTTMTTKLTTSDKETTTMTAELTTSPIEETTSGLSGEECPDCTGGVRQDCCQWRCYHDPNNWLYNIFCEDGAVIDVKGAGFGFSKCTAPDPCCPVKEDCRVPVVEYRPERMDYIYKQCHGKSRCHYLQAEWAANIKECNNGMSNYEIIYFDCVSKHPNSMAAPAAPRVSPSPVEKTTSGAPSWGIQISVIIPLVVFSFWYGN